MPLTGLRVAVTGATGFLGAHVVARLAERGAQVRVLYRDAAKARDLLARGFEGAQADLGDPDSLARAMADCHAVVATAALSTRGRAAPEAFYAANAQGSAHLMDAAAAAGVPRVVYISTIAVYRVRPWRNNDEDTPLIATADEAVGWSRFVTNPHYSRSKAIGEQVARERAQTHGIGLTILRPGPIYGSGDVKTTAIYARLAAWPIVPAPTFRMPHVHAGDVATAAAGALANPASAGRAYNVTGPSVSTYDVLAAWKRVTGRGPILVPLPIPVWVAFDDGAAERDLGFRARGLDEGLAEVFPRR